METNPAGVALDPPSRGYSRTTVDSFRAEAAVERERLLRVIAEAGAREERARAAVSMYEVMLTMLLDAQRDLSARRVDAELAAAEILEAADRDARAILGSGHGLGFTAFGSSPNPSAPETAGAPGSARVASIDLAAAEALDGATGHVVMSSPAFAGANGAPQLAGEHGGSPDEFLDFLRGALVDDEPLGPRPE